MRRRRVATVSIATLGVALEAGGEGIDLGLSIADRFTDQSRQRATHYKVHVEFRSAGRGHDGIGAAADEEPEGEAAGPDHARWRRELGDAHRDAARGAIAEADARGDPGAG